MKKTITIMFVLAFTPFMQGSLQKRLAAHQAKIAEVKDSVKAGSLSNKPGCGCGSTSNCNS